MGVKEELSKLVDPSALGVAFVAQTGAILSVTFGTWTLMYLYSPSRSLRLRFPSLNNAYMNVEFFIQRRIDSLPLRIRNSNILDWNRVVVSGAEAWIIRKPLIPFTYPFSVAVGVYAGTKFYDWRHGSKISQNPVNMDQFQDIDYDDTEDRCTEHQFQSRARLRGNTQDWTNLK